MHDFIVTLKNKNKIFTSSTFWIAYMESDFESEFDGTKKNEYIIKYLNEVVA